MRRLLTVLGVATVLVAPAVFTTMTVASADTSAVSSHSHSGHYRHARADLTVVTDAAGNTHVSGRLTVHAGRVVFHFVSQNAHAGSDVEVYRAVTRAATPGEVVEKIRQQNAGGPHGPTPAQLKVAAASTQWLTKNTRFFGGGSITGAGSTSSSATLTRGTYTLLDIGKVFSGAKATDAVVARLRVVGHLRNRSIGSSTATVKMVYEHGMDLFETSGHFDADAGIKVTNHGDVIHFVVFEPVVEGTTDVQITALFDAFQGKGKPGPDPTDHSRVGVQEGVLSPGQSAVFRSPLLKPGLYDLECFIADDVTGLPHAFMGMHKIVRVSQ